MPLSVCVHVRPAWSWFEPLLWVGVTFCVLEHLEWVGSGIAQRGLEPFLYELERVLLAFCEVLVVARAVARWCVGPSDIGHQLAHTQFLYYFWRDREGLSCRRGHAPGAVSH